MENESGDEGEDGAAAVVGRANAEAEAEGEDGAAEEAGAGVPHRRRPMLSSRHPVHVVLRVVGAVGNLRRRLAYHAVRAATIVAMQRQDFRICHLSLQRTHIHLRVEAGDRRALSRGLQSFQISAAKQLNRAISKDRTGPRRRGPVFSDRYDAEIIESPLQARRALSYVLNPAGPGWSQAGHALSRQSRSSAAVVGLVRLAIPR